MELIKVIKEDKVKVIFKVGESEMPEQNSVKPLVINVNEIIFDTVEQAKDYFKAVSEHNKAVIEDNTKRLDQIDANSLEKITEFIEIVKKTKALSKRNSEKIEGLITAHETMESFKYNIKLTTERNKINEQIISELDKL